MLSTITAILGGAISTSTIGKTSSSDIFEAYTFSLVVAAAKAEGASVKLLSRDGKVTSGLVFRTGPGFIYSKAHNYTHALLSFQGKPPLEVHNGVRVSGKSNVLHELDVAVIDSAEAENCRLNDANPRSSKVIIGVECKHYASALQLHLARGFIGLIADLSVKNSYFVTNTKSDSVTKLLSHRAKNSWEMGVTPSCKNTEVDNLIHGFRKCFRNYIAQ